MSLTAWCGDRKLANAYVVLLALHKQPSLIIDCGNAADPHRYMPYVGTELLAGAHVVPVDIIYGFRDALYEAPRHLEELGARVLAVTSYHELFQYDDGEENSHIHHQGWRLLRKLSRKYEVHVAVTPEQRLIAEHYAEVRDAMGHTVSSQRQIIDELIGELRAYAKSLRAEDLPYYEELLAEPLKHLGSITYTSSLHAWAFLILSILVEERKRERKHP